jgi:hypothetical protein
MVGGEIGGKTGIARLLEISAEKPWHLLFAVIFSSAAGVLYATQQGVAE